MNRVGQVLIFPLDYGLPTCSVNAVIYPGVINLGTDRNSPQTAPGLLMDHTKGAAAVIHDPFSSDLANLTIYCGWSSGKIDRLIDRNEDISTNPHKLQPAVTNSLVAVSSLAIINGS
jgi:hypothetical protein